jgi:protein TonB
LYDEAAVKMLQGSPKWLPGIRDGKPVKVKYNIPIRFSL